MPAIVPEPHGGAVLAGELGRGPVVGIEGNVAVNGAGPLGWTALVDRGDGGDPHRVRFLRLHRSDPGDEDGIVANGSRQAGYPLFPRSETCVPEGAKRHSRIPAEAKYSSGATTIGLRLERSP